MAAEIQKQQSREIISTVLHQINIGNKECKNIPILDHSDLEGYLSDVLNEVKNKEQKRLYEFARDITDFKTILTSYGTQQILKDNPSSLVLAKKLLDVEIDTDKKYGHLGTSGNGHVKKGSFLQFLYKENGNIFYLGVKIEHQEFLDEADFKLKVGLSIANKIYKACSISFISCLPSEINIYDTNAKASKYWWHDFLALKVVRDDELNTKESSDEVIKVLKRYKKDFPLDYTILRNSTIGAFKQAGEMKYDEFITNIFENYIPENKMFLDKKDKLLKSLKELPAKKKFDTHFTLVPSAVSFKKSKVPLSSEINIEYDEDMLNIKDKIWAEETIDGRKLVVINSPDGYKNFILKERKK